MENNLLPICGKWKKNKIIRPILPICVEKSFSQGFFYPMIITYLKNKNLYYF